MTNPNSLVGEQYAEPTFETIESYWRDPAPFYAEQAAMRAKVNALLDTKRDADLRRLGYL